jgi:WD40 repeat protein
VIRDTATGEELLRLRGHTVAIASTAFSPNGRRILTTSYDETIKV